MSKVCKICRRKLVPTHRESGDSRIKRKGEGMRFCCDDSPKQKQSGYEARIHQIRIRSEEETMRWSDERILTTHTGSLPRPPELTRLYVRRARGEAIDPAELDQVGKAASRRIVDKQIEAGVDVGNNGEQQREAFFLYVRHRMSGFGDSWQRWPRGDVERYPLLKQQMAQLLAAREAVGNYQPPKAIGEVRYANATAFNAQITDFRTALEAKPNGCVEPVMTAPSPGIIAAAMKNEYYDSEEAYLAAVAAAIQIEYEAIVESGFLLQLDCPDLALERHLTYRLSDSFGPSDRIHEIMREAASQWRRLADDSEAHERRLSLLSWAHAAS